SHGRGRADVEVALDVVRRTPGDVRPRAARGRGEQGDAGGDRQRHEQRGGRSAVSIEFHGGPPPVRALGLGICPWVAMRTVWPDRGHYVNGAAVRVACRVRSLSLWAV